MHLAPVLHGMRYTSFGRHFTSPDKLREVCRINLASEDVAVDNRSIESMNRRNRSVNGRRGVVFSMAMSIEKKVTVLAASLNRSLSFKQSAE